MNDNKHKTERIFFDKEEVKNVSKARLTTTALLKKRFSILRKELKMGHNLQIKHFREYVLNADPEFNNPQGWEKIGNVWYGRSSDLYLTELLEGMVQSLKSKSS